MVFTTIFLRYDTYHRFWGVFGAFLPVVNLGNRIFRLTAHYMWFLPHFESQCIFGISSTRRMGHVLELCFENHHRHHIYELAEAENTRTTLASDT